MNFKISLATNNFFATGYVVGSVVKERVYRDTFFKIPINVNTERTIAMNVLFVYANESIFNQTKSACINGNLLYVCGHLVSSPKKDGTTILVVDEIKLLKRREDYVDGTRDIKNIFEVYEK